MVTIAIVLNTSKKLTHGEYPVTIRVTHQYKRKYITINALLEDQSIKYRCSQEHWKPAEYEDNGLGRFRKSFPRYKECNLVLNSKLTEATDIIKRYEQDLITFSFDQFEKDLKGKDSVVVQSLQQYYSVLICVLDKQGRVGLSGLYYECQRILKKFSPEANIIDVNTQFLESFEYWMRNVRGNKDTTISVKMRNLQRVINQAIQDKLFKQQDYPFGEKKYFINKRLDHSTKKLAIHTDKISRLKAIAIEQGSALHFAQQLCLFSYYCRGMNFIDMAFLKWDAVSDTHIEYTRRKTRGKFMIPLNQYSKSILEWFRATHINNQGYVFPIIDPTIHITPKQQYTRKKSALKAVNHNLKLLAGMIQEPALKLSTNVFRHSYATGMKRSGAETSHIKDALGHSTELQTQTYLAGFEAGVIESWEDKVFAL